MATASDHEPDEFDDLEFDFPLDQLDLSSAQFASQIPLPVDRKRSGDVDDSEGEGDEEDSEVDFLNEILAEALPSIQQALPAKTIGDLALVASPTKSTSGASLHTIEALETELADIEDIGNMIERVSPFFAFRRKGFFSVSDLVGPLWCEVQYDYRLRTLPFLPVDQRPTQIVTETGKTIQVDKKLVESHDKIMKKGNVVHKKLEREIHPEEIKVSTTTREDVWGLRFLNMLSSLEALMTLGKCRELPVVGFIKDYMVVGVIDEIVRKPIPEPGQTTPTKAKANGKGKGKTVAEPPTPQPKQLSLMKFLLPMPSSTPPKAKPKSAIKTHELFVSDSKTRASGTMPRPENTQSGQMQLMLYKELLDGLLKAGRATPEPSTSTSTGVAAQDILPSSAPFSFARLFSHLGLDSAASFSPTFLRESRAVVKGNALRDGAADATCLNDMVHCWTAYVERLSLGPDPRSEPFLELVYRRTGKPKVPKEQSKKRRKTELAVDDEEHQLQRAIEESLKAPPPASASPPPLRLSQVSKASTVGKYWAGTQGRSHSEEKEDAELATALEMSLEPATHEAPVEEQDVVMSEVVPPEISMDATASLLSRPQQLEESRSLPASPSGPGMPAADGDDGDSVAIPLPASVLVSEESAAEVLVAAAEKSVPVPVGQMTGTAADSSTTEDTATTDSFADGKAPVEDAALDQQPSIPPSSQPEPSTPAPRRSKRLAETPATQASSSASAQQSSQVETPAQTPGPTAAPVDKEASKGSGSIIGKHRFRHSPESLAAHLNSVLAFWIGERAPVGVKVEDTSRCGWCEFEEGCEWRAKKAEEAILAARARAAQRQ